MDIWEFFQWYVGSREDIEEWEKLPSKSVYVFWDTLIYTSDLEKKYSYFRQKKSLYLGIALDINIV